MKMGKMERVRLLESEEERERLVDVVNSWQDVPVLTVGDIMADKTLYEQPTGISPEGTENYNIISEKYSLGGAGNVARNIASLGGTPFLLGVVGNDIEGRTANGKYKCLFDVDFLTELCKSDIDVSLVKDRTRPTTLKIRRYDHETKKPIGFRESRETTDDISVEIESELLKRFKGLKGQFSAIAFSDYGKGTLTERVVRDIMKFARHEDLPVIVDPKHEYEMYKGATIFKPNVDELSKMRKKMGELKWRIAAERLAREHFSSVAVTEGDRGIYLFTSKPNNIHADIKHIPTVPQDVYEISGAGDTVTAVYALACAAGVNEIDASVIANFAAGTVIRKPGVVPADAEEVQEAILDYVPRDVPFPLIAE